MRSEPLRGVEKIDRPSRCVQTHEPVSRKVDEPGRVALGTLKTNHGR